MTEDYFIICCVDILLIVRKKDIEERNQENVISFEKNTDYNNIPKLYDKPQIKAEVIDLRKLFDSNTVGAVLTVTIVSQLQVNMVERVKRRKNVI
jgi:hypothetical protein